MFLRALAFLVTVCCLTWVGVLWWWQRSGHSAEVSDLVLYLGLLPLAIALLLLGLRWVWQRAAARRAAAAVAKASAASGTVAAVATATTNAAEAAERHAVTQLVLASVCCVAGDQAGDLASAAAAGKPLPQPDDSLSNDEGLPVLCARIPDKLLGLDASRTELATVLDAVRTQVKDRVAGEPQDHVWRALAALRSVLEAQRDGLWSLHQASQAMQEEDGFSAERLPPSQRPALPGVRVLLGCPAHWSVLEQEWLRAWAEHCLDPARDGLSGAYALTFNVMAGSGEELWLRADQTSHAAGRSPWLLVAACDSDLSEARVEALSAARALYDASSQPGGCMPGEAAAAVLLAPADWVPPDDKDMPVVRLHRPALLRRDKPVEAAGRVAHGELAQALSQSLVAAQVEAAQVGVVVCDADVHSNRSAELYGLAVDVLPHLDPVEDTRLLGRVTGRTGVVGPLLLLAVVAEAVRTARQPGLVLTLGDSLLRMSLVVQLPAEGESDRA